MPLQELCKIAFYSISSPFQFHFCVCTYGRNNAILGWIQSLQMNLSRMHVKPVATCIMKALDEVTNELEFLIVVDPDTQLY